MSTKKYISDNGLSYFLSKLKETFGTKEAVDASKEILDIYVLNIDYTQLEFDTDSIVSGGSSATLGVGQLGIMVLGSL